MIAIEKGFQVIADYIKDASVGNECIRSLQDLQNKPEFQNLLKENKEEEIIEGSKEIIAAEIVANAEIREFLRSYLEKKSNIVSKIK
jgi:transcriptional accessory protein Tex/SPT6